MNGQSQKAWLENDSQRVLSRATVALFLCKKKKMRACTRRLPQIPIVRRYHDRVVNHYESPRNVGSFDKTDRNIGTGLVGAPACGDVMKLQVRVHDGIVTDACFKTFGCGSAIASSSYTTEAVIGLKLDEAAALTNKDIAKHLKLPPVKLHCSMLAEDGIKAAIADYRSKNVETTADTKHRTRDGRAMP